jgi:hypothetical protein
VIGLQSVRRTVPWRVIGRVLFDRRLGAARAWTYTELGTIVPCPERVSERRPCVLWVDSTPSRRFRKDSGKSRPSKVFLLLGWHSASVRRSSPENSSSATSLGNANKIQKKRVAGAVLRDAVQITRQPAAWPRHRPAPSSRPRGWHRAGLRTITRSPARKWSTVDAGPLSASTARTLSCGPAGQCLAHADLHWTFRPRRQMPLYK